MLMKGHLLMRRVFIAMCMAWTLLNFGLPIDQLSVDIQSVQRTIGGDIHVSRWTNEVSLFDVQQKSEIWANPKDEGYTQCVKQRRSQKFGAATKGYILVRANGGLNQMRLGISDMVAIAKLMNVILVIPFLDNSSYWRDSSEFKDIYDIKIFVDALRDGIAIVEELPQQYAGIKPYEIEPDSFPDSSYYRSLSKIFEEHEVVKFMHKNSRLSNNNVPRSIQKLRCRANFEALQFTPYIEELGRIIVNSLRSGGKPYIAFHLRYEKDMTSAEVKELRSMRYSAQHWRYKKINGTERRLQGRRPITPRETVLFLTAMGYPSTTNIYIASGKIYGAHRLNMVREVYPNLHTHFTLSTKEELQPLVNYQNKLAAIDFVVARESDMFVYTHNGNMAKAVRGHRRFNGFLKTINPNRKILVELIDQQDGGDISWQKFQDKVRDAHRNRIGAPYQRERGETPWFEESFHANPLPECMCVHGGSSNRRLH